MKPNKCKHINNFCTNAYIKSLFVKIPHLINQSSPVRHSSVFLK